MNTKDNKLIYESYQSGSNTDAVVNAVVEFLMSSDKQSFTQQEMQDAVEYWVSRLMPNGLETTDQLTHILNAAANQLRSKGYEAHGGTSDHYAKIEAGALNQAAGELRDWDVNIPGAAQDNTGVNWKTEQLPDTSDYPGRKPRPKRNIDHELDRDPNIPR